MKSLHSNINPLMKFSPLQAGISSRPIHENYQSNSEFITEKNSKTETALNQSINNKK